MSKILRASAKCILFKSKTLKDGTHPVMLRITFKGERKYYTTTFNLTASHYDGLFSKSRLSKNDSNLLTEINAIEIRAQTTINRLIEDKKTFSFTQFEKLIFVEVSNTDVFDLLRKRIAYYDSKDAFSTRNSFKNALAHLRKYMGKKKLNLEDITPEFLVKYEKANSHLSPNTLGIYERNLRVIFNEAIDNGAISSSLNPFKKHRIPFRPGIKKALKKEEMLKILNHHTDRYSYPWLVQQIYIFSYLCNGLNLKDMTRLKWTDVSDGRIYFTRVKTINTTALPRMQSILINEPLHKILLDLQHYKNDDSGYIFPILTKGLTEEKKHNRKNDFIGVINDNMRKIAAELEIKKDFTFYSARHSWATILKREGISVELISEGMSHSSIRVTELYLDSFGDATLDKANEQLL
jgi:integrase/recombinase XerD